MHTALTHPITMIRGKLVVWIREKPSLMRFGWSYSYQLCTSSQAATCLSQEGFRPQTLFFCNLLKEESHAFVHHKQMKFESFLTDLNCFALASGSFPFYQSKRTNAHWYKHDVWSVKDPNHSPTGTNGKILKLILKTTHELVRIHDLYP